ncbi:MAG: hypothetical protein EBQ73_14155 [Gammaproteobacteria bacterium]|nr:hypothetical protein [Gammaproteobacteria bacterium]
MGLVPKGQRERQKEVLLRIKKPEIFCLFENLAGDMSFKVTKGSSSPAQTTGRQRNAVKNNNNRGLDMAVLTIFI